MSICPLMNAVCGQVVGSAVVAWEGFEAAILGGGVVRNWSSYDMCI